MTIPHLLHRLLAAEAPTGSEAPAVAVFREAAGSFGELETDRLGNTIARPPGQGPVVALVAHADEIGVVVTHVEDDGLLAIAPLGGWHPETMVGQRVRLLTAAGPLDAVAAVRSSRAAREERKLPEWRDLHLDVGARDGDEARSLVRPGDAGVVTAAPVELRNGRIAARALDDRVGLYVVLEAARRAAEERTPVRLAPVATVREETGGGVAAVAAYTFELDAAIAVDVTYATDVPGESARIDGAHALGSGPAIARGPVAAGPLVDALVAAAERERIPFTYEAVRRLSNTDADDLQTARAGTPTALVSVPLRYMHTPVEVVEPQDVEATIALLLAFAREPLAP